MTSANSTQNSGPIITRHHHPPGAKIGNSAHYGKAVRVTTDTPIAAHAGKTSPLGSNLDVIALSAPPFRLIGSGSDSLQRCKPCSESRRQTLEQALVTAKIPNPNRHYAEWQGERTATPGLGSAVLISSNITPCSGANAVGGTDASGSSLHGTGRPAAPKRARQNTVEPQSQAMSRIAITHDAAFSVPLTISTWLPPNP